MPYPSKTFGLGKCFGRIMRREEEILEIGTKSIEIVKRVKAERRSTLTEAESKQLLKQYGIPVVEEFVAATRQEAAAQASRYGYPIVLKGLGSNLTHKTERGLVHLNLKTEAEVLAAADAVAEAAGQELEGFLIQPMLKGNREFVAELFCDP